jgi:hypothetical protein
MSAPAPPVSPEDDAEARELATPSATLLDYYASAAMRSLLTDSVRRGLTAQSVARESFDLAFAMVQERRRRLPKGSPP